MCGDWGPQTVVRVLSKCMRLPSPPDQPDQHHACLLSSTLPLANRVQLPWNKAQILCGDLVEPHDQGRIGMRDCSWPGRALGSMPSRTKGALQHTGLGPEECCRRYFAPPLVQPRRPADTIFQLRWHHDERLALSYTLKLAETAL